MYFSWHKNCYFYYVEYFWNLFLDSWYFCSLFQLLCGSLFCKFFSKPSPAAQPPLALVQGLFQTRCDIVKSGTIRKRVLAIWESRPCAIGRPVHFWSLCDLGLDDVESGTNWDIDFFPGKSDSNCKLRLVGLRKSTLNPNVRREAWTLEKLVFYSQIKKINPIASLSYGWT